METTFELLVSNALNNNEEAIEALMNATKNVAYFKAFNYVKNEQDALEVVQVSYINAFSKLNTLEDPSKFDRWFYSIVTRESLNFIKTAEARYTVKFTDIEQKNDDDIKLHTFDQGYSEWDALIRGYSGIKNGEKIVDIDVPFIKSYKN